MTRADNVPRTETDAYLEFERKKTDNELARRMADADADADQLLNVARNRAERLLVAARAAADGRLPLGEQTKAAAALLLQQREQDDQVLAAEREVADELLGSERRQREERVAGLLALERQATDLRLALERASADKAVTSRDKFLSQASHDLGQLMAAQKIYLALIVKEAEESQRGGPLASHVSTLVEINGLMDRMIRDLVDNAAIDAGRLTVALSPQSAANLVHSAAAVFKPVANDRGQSLSLTPALADVSVEADSTRAIQVLGNLLSNAIKFTPPGGSITVGFEVANEGVVFFVADTGPGVPPENVEHIFERFVGSRSSPGLGLGLFIARHLVDAHGGRLWLDRAATTGATFRFTLRRTK